MKVLTALIIVCVSLEALSWGYEGHRVIVQIAIDFLSRSVSSKVVNKKMMKILNSDANGKPTGSKITPPMIASFADDMRGNPNFDCIKMLHFVNIPPDVTDYQTYADKNPAGDAVTAVEALAKFMRSNDQADLDAVPAFTQLRVNVPIDQALALKLFLHFFGDLYQPLHLGYPEDFGANTIEVKMFGQITNLHSIMDGILKPFLTDPTAYSKDLEREETTTTKKLSLRETLLQAVNDTLALRATLYQFTEFETVTVKPAPGSDPNAPPITKQIPIIDDSYIARIRPLLEAQLIKGGLMLKHALRQIFDPEHTPGPNPYVPRKVTCERLF